MRLSRQIIAWTSMASLLAAIGYAPLFHVHTDTGQTPLVHSHLPDLEVSDDDSVVHMEPPHSHAASRSIDVLTTIASHIIQIDAAIQSSQHRIIEPQPSRGFVAATTPRAHAPP